MFQSDYQYIHNQSHLPACVVERADTFKSLGGPHEERLSWADQGECKELPHGEGESICGAMVSMSRDGWRLCLWDFGRKSQWHRRWARSADQFSAGVLRALLDPSREAIHIFRCRLSSVCISRVFFLQPTRAYARTARGTSSRVFSSA
jgi:hypothetical protein